jgi:hypothetical protein
MESGELTLTDSHLVVRGAGAGQEIRAVETRGAKLHAPAGHGPRRKQLVLAALELEPALGRLPPFEQNVQVGRQGRFRGSLVIVPAERVDAEREASAKMSGVARKPCTQRAWFFGGVPDVVPEITARGTLGCSSYPTEAWPGRTWPRTYKVSWNRGP